MNSDTVWQASSSHTHRKHLLTLETVIDLSSGEYLESPGVHVRRDWRFCKKKSLP